MSIQAIETKYKGYRFRSRAEARWAVFFDHMGYAWEYEPEGFTLPSGWYLPDFYIKGIGFAEVKGSIFSDNEKQKCLELSKLGRMVMLLDGVPDEKSYEMFLDGESISNAIFIPDGEKFAPLFYGYDFDSEYFQSTIESVHKSRAARFN